MQLPACLGTKASSPPTPTGQKALKKAFLDPVFSASITGVSLILPPNYSCCSLLRSEQTEKTRFLEDEPADLEHQFILKYFFDFFIEVLYWYNYMEVIAL